MNTESLILNVIPSIVVLIDTAGRVVEWNRAAEEVLGIARAQASGRCLTDLAIGWDTEKLMASIDAALSQGEPQRLDLMDYQRPSGDKGILGLTLIALRSERGEVLGCILQGAEISDRKRLESQLAQTQKMESIGQLAAGIAHEINTPTQYIGDNTRFLQEAFTELAQVAQAYEQLLKESLGEPLAPEIAERIEALREGLDLDYLYEEIPRALAQSLEGIGQVSRIVQAMKQFSHPDSQEKALANINAALENTATVARNEWKYSAELTLDLDPALPSVPCFLGELNQAFLNIIVNAVHAIEKKLGRDSGQKGHIVVATRARDGWVEIRIQDSGSGIPVAVQPRIFDLFFTTKEVGKGTGQGLAIAYSVVVEKHNGTITFETEEGVGTTFIIRLPLVDMENKYDV